jgi:hypothetical protein
MAFIKFTDYIDSNAFFISLALGLLFFYVIAPQKRVIIKYPNPENANTQVYKDKYDNDNCYKFKAEEVKCPANKALIKDISNLD